MATYDHWLPLHIGDYVADTMHLTTLQHGIYIRLIMHYWKHRGLPSDDVTLAQIAGLTVAKFKRNKLPICALFSNDMSHKRLDIELQHAMSVAAKRSEAGKEGAEARWQKPFPRARARASHSHNHSQDTPPKPPTGGQRARPARNGFVDLAHEMMEAAPDETEPAEQSSPHRGRVVDLTRHRNSG